MPRIAITDYFNEPSQEEKNILGDLVGVGPDEDTEVLMVWHESINEEYCSKFPKLKGVQRYGVGFDNLDLDYLKSRKIVCCNNPDYGVDEVSDTAVAFIMAISRGILNYDVAARGYFDTWQENIDPTIKRNKDIRLGVIGAGRIGSSVLLKTKAIGYSTVFYDPYKESGHEKVLKADRARSLEELLEKSDIISFHCPLNAENKGMINEAFIEKMKPGSSLVNTARGGLLESTDVLKAPLISGHLKMVALDVIPNEPPKPEEDLMRDWRDQADYLKGRLLINPHSSYFSQQSILDMRISAAENAKRLLEEEQALNIL